MTDLAEEVPTQGTKSLRTESEELPAEPTQVSHQENGAPPYQDPPLVLNPLVSTLLEHDSTGTPS